MSEQSSDAKDRSDCMLLVNIIRCMDGKAVGGWKQASCAVGVHCPVTALVIN